MCHANYRPPCELTWSSSSDFNSEWEKCLDGRSGLRLARFSSAFTSAAPFPASCSILLTGFCTGGSILRLLSRAFHSLIHHSFPRAPAEFASGSTSSGTSLGSHKPVVFPGSPANGPQQRIGDPRLRRLIPRKDFVVGIRVLG
jgi:hypothetical protein